MYHGSDSRDVGWPTQGGHIGAAKGRNVSFPVFRKSFQRLPLRSSSGCECIAHVIVYASMQYSVKHRLLPVVTSTSCQVCLLEKFSLVIDVVVSPRKGNDGVKIFTLVVLMPLLLDKGPRAPIAYSNDSLS